MLSKLYKITLYALALLCTFSCSTINPSHTQEEGEGVHTYFGWCFSVLIPNDIKVKNESTMHDFELYTFTYSNNGNTAILNAYAGNHPEIKHVSTSSEETVVKLKNMKIKWISAETNDHLYNADVLIDINNDFPRYVHFWYDNISKDTKNAFDMIIKSTTYDTSFSN